MNDLRQAFEALDPAARRRVQIALCVDALPCWEAYAAAHAPIDYVESIVGTQQRVDLQLPAQALACVQAGTPAGDIAHRYLEPITAMHEDDLELPDPVQFAYYAIYNLFRRYALGRPIDDWLIVNQALSSSLQATEWALRLHDVIRRATSPNVP